MCGLAEHVGRQTIVTEWKDCPGPGGSGNIGQEIARTYAEAGACVVAVGKTASKIETTMAALRKFDVGCEGVCADITRPEELKRTIDGTITHHKRIDILVDAQGATIRSASEHLSREAFDDAIALNLASVTFACIEVGREMIARGSGAIVNIASISAHRGFQGSLLSTITKHGVLGLTRTLGTEWASRGIRVNAISPGFLDASDGRVEPAFEGRLDMLLRRTPLGRFGCYSEVASAALFLASAGASFMTGQTLIVDGGYLAAGVD